MGELFGLLAGVAFGLAAVLARRAIQKAGVFRAVYWNFLINVVVFGSMVVLVWASGRFVPPSREVIGVFALGGFAALVLGRTFLYMAISRIGPSRASAFRVSTPLFTALLALLFLTEQLTWVRASGILIILAGMLAISLEATGRRPNRSAASDPVVTTETAGATPPPEREAGVSLAADVASPTGAVASLAQEQSCTPFLERLRSPSVVGVAAGVISAMSFSAGDILRKSGIMMHPDPVLASAISALAAWAVYTVIALLQGQLLSTLRLPKNAWRPVLLSSLAGCGALLFFNISLRTVPVSIATPLASTQGLFTILLSRLLEPGRELITRRLIIASVCVFVGLILVVTS